MAGERPDLILQRAVQRIHEHGPPFDWVGIYLRAGARLVLHSNMGGPTDLARIPVGQGVCGTAVAEGRDINVPDVNAVEYYLARSASTRSQMVLLIQQDGRIIGVLDIDSDTAAAFSEDEERELRHVAEALGQLVGPKLR